MESLRSRVCASDLPNFDSRVQGIRNEILSAIADYGMLQASLESCDKSHEKGMWYIGSHMIELHMD